MDIQVTPLDEAARDILRLNDKGTYTVPTAGLYPYQWNWDSAFAALGFARFDINRAWVELETLFSAQWDSGMVPHIIFHAQDDGYFPGPDVWGGVGPIPSSGVTQPPVAATLARWIYENDPKAGRDRLAALYQPMLRWHQWFMDWRLDQGAVCTTHPWETGRDNAPDWDDAMAAIDPVGVGTYTRRDTTHVDADMRPTKDDYDRYIWLVQRGKSLGWDEEAMLADPAFRVADPTMTFILLRAQRDLAWIGQELGQDVREIEAAIAVLEDGARSLWNAGISCYDSRNVLTGRWSGAISNASFLCWYAGLPAPDMRAVLDQVMGAVRYGVPSLDARDPRHDPKRYWRGPVWAIMNTMIAIGLAEQGHPEAEQIRADTAALIAEHGFSEYFNPHDGSPAGGKSFTWTAAVWLGWASPTAGG